MFKEKLHCKEFITHKCSEKVEGNQEEAWSMIIKHFQTKIAPTHSNE